MMNFTFLIGFWTGVAVHYAFQLAGLPMTASPPEVGVIFGVTFAFLRHDMKEGKE